MVLQRSRGSEIPSRRVDSWNAASLPDSAYRLVRCCATLAHLLHNVRILLYCVIIVLYSFWCLFVWAEQPRSFRNYFSPQMRVKKRKTFLLGVSDSSHHGVL